MRNRILQFALLSTSIFVTEAFAGDEEEVIADIVQTWKDFSLKNPATEMSHSEGAWMATSEGGLWQFLTAEEANSMVIDAPNIFDFTPYHINVKFVGEKQDVAYAAYYLAGNILDADDDRVADVGSDHLHRFCHLVPTTQLRGDHGAPATRCRVGDDVSSIAHRAEHWLTRV